jgi:intracellular septation protein
VDRFPLRRHNVADFSRPPMKFLFDIFPLVLFFVAFKMANIYVATGVAMAATFLQIGWLWFAGRKIDPMLWASLAIIVVFGGATLLFHNETFIKWKPTVLYWLFAGALFVSNRWFGKNLIRTMMEKNISLPEPIWGKLNLSWIGFFALMGMLNIYIAYNYNTETWVNFKVIGGVGLMVLFVIVQGLFLSKHVVEKESR